MRDRAPTWSARLGGVSFALLVGCASHADPIAAWKREAEVLRGLEFRDRVAVRSFARGEIKAMMLAQISGVMPPDEMKTYRDAYAALGVMPPGTDLLALFSDIYGEQMAGRYDPRERALYLLDSSSPGGYPRATVAVHELVHALQHQHFARTLELTESLRHNDDLVAALAGAIEGDASFTMLGADDGNPESQRDLATAQGFRDEMLAEIASPSGALARAPFLIRLSVIAPYAQGVMLAAERYLAEGNDGLDALLEDGPLSTAELFDPASERASSETTFVDLPLAELERALEPLRCEIGHHNVAGSMTLLALFEDRGDRGAEAESLARGWSGDRFVRIDCPGGTELLWLTFWRSDAAAARFEAAYTSIAPALARNAPLAGVPEARRTGASVLVLTPGLAPVAALALEKSVVRSYSRLSRWIEEACPGEGGGCPRPPSVEPARADDRAGAPLPLQIAGAFGFKQAPALAAYGDGQRRARRDRFR